MSNGMVPAGVFRLKGEAPRNAPLAHNPGGLWQAWKMPDGRFMVRPLDQDENPWGTACVLEALDFGVAFASWRPPEEGADGAAKPGRADEPDILLLWYEQALADQQSRDAELSSATVPASGSRGDLHAGWRASASGKKRMAPDESILEPPWDPDEFFFSEEKTSSFAGPDVFCPAGTFKTDSSLPVETAGVNGPYAPPAREEQRPGPAAPPRDVAGSGDQGEDGLFADVFTQEEASFTSPLDFMPELFLDAEPRPAPPAETASGPVPFAETAPGAVPPAAGTPAVIGADGPSRFAASAVTLEVAEYDGEVDREVRDDDARAEAGAQRLERQMRKEFDTLLEQFDNGTSLDVERDLSRLLLRGTGFSWKQKFMFTEFGVALRRRRLHKLALASHIRALGLSPSDEHVLFNVARSEYDLGNVEEAKTYLTRSLEAAPAFDAAVRFLDFLNGRAKNGV